MYIYQLKIKLKSTNVGAVALKILRSYCPNTSIGELRNKVLNHEAVYATDLLHVRGRFTARYWRTLNWKMKDSSVRRLPS